VKVKRQGYKRRLGGSNEPREGITTGCMFLWQSSKWPWQGLNWSPHSTVDNHSGWAKGGRALLVGPHPYEIQNIQMSITQQALRGRRRRWRDGGIYFRRMAGDASWEVVAWGLHELWTTGHLQPVTCLCVTCELRMAFTF
jgi:hypothetical protein